MPTEQPSSWARAQMHEGIAMLGAGVSLNFQFCAPEEGNEGRASMVPRPFHKACGRELSFGLFEGGGVSGEQHHRPLSPCLDSVSFTPNCRIWQSTPLPPVSLIQSPIPALFIVRFLPVIF